MTDAPALVGTWRLVSFLTPDETGGWRPYWDDRASGLIVYTPDRRVSAQVYDARRPRLETPWEQVSPAAAQGVRGYRFLTPDRIELRVLTSADGQSAENAVLVWERVRA